jgi:hypothetical protein
VPFIAIFSWCLGQLRRSRLSLADEGAAVGGQASTGGHVFGTWQATRGWDHYPQVNIQEATEIHRFPSLKPFTHDRFSISMLVATYPGVLLLCLPIW